MTDLFENDEIYHIPETGPIMLYFNHTNFPGPLICTKKSALSEPNIALLKKILTAIGYVPEKEAEIAVLEDGVKYSFSELIKKSPSRHTILLGNLQEQFDLQFHVIHNQWISFGDYHILFSFDLDELANDQGRKQELWIALKTKYK